MNQEFRDAAIFGDLDTLRRLQASDAELIHETDKYKFTALHEAVGEHCTEVVRFLLESGANPNAQNDTGHAPLHLAAYPEHVGLLVKHGADLNLQTNDAATPLATHASEQDRADVMLQLLELGADPNMPSDSGTPLSIAQQRQEYDKVEILSQYLE